MDEKQLLYDREQLKKSQFYKKKQYYALLESNDRKKYKETAKVKYRRKFETAWNKYSNKFDRITEQLLKNNERKDKGVKIVKYKKQKKGITRTKVKSLIQKYVRLRDSDEYGYGNCIVTGERLHYKEANGGHYISASYKKTALNTDNIHLQSPGSNKAMSMGDKTADYHLERYRANLIDKIGLKRVKALEKEHEERKYKIVKFTKADLKQIYDHYLPLVKELEGAKKSEKQ